MCQQSLVGRSKALKRGSAELGEAAKLCVFVLGNWYLGLGVLGMHTHGQLLVSMPLTGLYIAQSEKRRIKS